MKGSSASPCQKVEDPLRPFQLYRVFDIEALAKDTHKFESRYCDGLIGPYPSAAETYRERSPIHYADQLNCPVILFQGLEDRVVPPSQAEILVSALREKGLAFAYLTFEGEQHGFRKAATLRAVPQRSMQRPHPDPGWQLVPTDNSVRIGGTGPTAILVRGVRAKIAVSTDKEARCAS